MIYDQKWQIINVSQLHRHLKYKIYYLTIIYQLTFLLDSKDENWHKINHGKLFEWQQSTARVKASRQIHQLFYKASMCSLQTIKKLNEMCKYLYVFDLTRFFKVTFLKPQQKTSPEVHRPDISCHTSYLELSTRVRLNRFYAWFRRS